MGDEYKEVRFDLYCETCKHKDLKETLDPCNECLEEGMNLESVKPIKWESQEE